MKLPRFLNWRRKQQPHVSVSRSEDTSKPAPDFVFTRTLDTDYCFTQFPRTNQTKQALQTSILKLQDYFTDLIDDVGYYSFPVGKQQWIIATITKTDKIDLVRRPIYEIKGNIFHRKALGTYWVAFATDEYTKDYAPLRDLKPGEYAANYESLQRFLQMFLYDHEPPPQAWAYGVKLQQLDNTDLPFSYRLIGPVNPEKPRKKQRAKKKPWGKSFFWLSLILAGTVVAAKFPLYVDSVDYRLGYAVWFCGVLCILGGTLGILRLIGSLHRSKHYS